MFVICEDKTINLHKFECIKIDRNSRDEFKVLASRWITGTITADCIEEIIATGRKAEMYKLYRAIVQAWTNGDQKFVLLAWKEQNKEEKGTNAEML